MFAPRYRLAIRLLLAGCAAALFGGCTFNVEGLPRPAGPECGNAELEEGETCDDGNTVGGDGCSESCQLETACGDGNLDPADGEVCDDGNTVSGDGCAGDCSSDETCGNGIVDVSVWEVCDDENTTDGDGCSADCLSDESCGNGIIDAASGEQCDDLNGNGGDGCNAICQTEPGWDCDFEPSVCRPVCGDGFLLGAEECDDGNLDPADGCDALCQVETGWTCAAGGAPCTPVCGDGLELGGELCDDGNLLNGDGCEDDCTPTLDCWSHQFNGHDYMFCVVPRIWMSANSTCTQMGYHLVKIENAAENTWVTDTAATYDTGPWWMGANDLGIEGIWLWTDGSSAAGSPMWGPGEPNNAGGIEDCGAFSEPTVPDYEWNDADCNHLKPCVCELQ